MGFGDGGAAADGEGDDDDDRSDGSPIVAVMMALAMPVMMGSAVMMAMGPTICS